VSDEAARAVLSADTAREAEDLQIARWREMSATEKAQLAASWSGGLDRVALAGIRLRHPNASDRECVLRLAALKLGRDLPRRVYPELSAVSDLP
jgi:hypothetical protein